MEHLAPVGNVYQAGTLSGNPISVSAGLKTLQLLETYDPYPELEAKGQFLETELNKIAAEEKYQVSFNRVGSMFTTFFTGEKVMDYETAIRSDTVKFSEYFSAMLKAGIYIAPSQYEAGFISAAHTREDLIKTASAVRTTLSEIFK